VVAIGFVGAVLGLGATAEAAVLDVSWTAPTTNANGTRLTDLAGYRVYIGTSTPACPGASFHAVASSTSSPSAGQTVSRTITGLNAGTTYAVRITAVDQSGNESACTAATSAAARGALAVSPTGSVSFGSVAVGGTVDRTFTVQNGTSSTVSGSASVGAPFSIVSGASYTLGAGASQTVTVRFRPTSATSYVANVSFTGGGDTLTRSVSGSGTGSSSTTPTLTVTRAGTGSGTVTSSPSGITCGSDCTQSYTAGTRVTLTASAASGSRFAGWSGGGCSGTGTCSVTLNASTGVTATFSPVTSSGGSSGSLPDLLLSSVSVPSTVSRTSSFGISFNLVNQGSGGASSVQVRIYLSRDTQLSSSDPVIRVRNWGYVAPKTSLANAIAETLPSGTGTGTYYLLLVVDPDGVVSETTKSNNGVVKTITVR
jgi:hypothetical protein